MIFVDRLFKFSAINSFFFVFQINMFSYLRRQINFKDLFPTRWSFIIFISYMGLFINQGLLVTGSKTASHSYNYNTIVVVLLTEFVKLVAALAIYRQK